MQPHEERVVIELSELSDKRTRLESFFSTSVFKAIPLDEQRRMQRQAIIMRLYEDVLDERIAHFPGSEVKGAKV